MSVNIGNRMQSLVSFILLVMMGLEMASGGGFLTGPDGDGSHVELKFKFGSWVLNDLNLFATKWGGFPCEINTTVNNVTSTMTMNVTNEVINCYYNQNYCLLCTKAPPQKEEDFYKCENEIKGARLMSPDSTLKMNRTIETCEAVGVYGYNHIAIDIRRYLHEWVVDDWYLNETSVKEWATWGHPSEVHNNMTPGINVVLTIEATGHALPVLTKIHGNYKNTEYGAICEVNVVNATVLASYNGTDNTTEDDWDCLEASGKKHCYYHRETIEFIRYQRKYCEANGGYLFSPSTTSEAKKVIEHFKAKSGFDTKKPVYIGISQICGSYQIANGTAPWNNSLWPYWANSYPPKFEETMNMPDCNRIYAHRCKYTPSKCPIDWKNNTVDTFDTNNDIRIKPDNKKDPTEPQSDLSEKTGLSTGALAGISAAVGLILLSLVAAVLVLIFRKPPESELISISAMPLSAPDADLNTNEDLGLVSAA